MLGIDAREKRELRRRMQRARHALSEATRTAYASAAVHHLMGTHAFDGCRTVGLYAACGTEADPTSLEPWLARRGVAIAYPRAHDGQLSFHLSQRRDLRKPEEALSVEGQAILEPPRDAPTVPLQAIDVLIVPGLAFSSRGARLGYGGGYYDRALAQSHGTAIAGASYTLARPGSEQHPRTIGFCFGLQILADDDVPQAAHDIRMGALVSELGFIAVHEASE
ncbi:MAG: 5-formyltetrahydrofolate cyclo-ligase [Deltaproteobacteria bacterium]|nr:5-formyltetrahydrofolate cyclo-ligase [Deltaproteobacteria bacterium]